MKRVSSLLEQTATELLRTQPKKESNCCRALQAPLAAERFQLFREILTGGLWENVQETVHGRGRVGSVACCCTPRESWEVVGTTLAVGGCELGGKRGATG